MKKFTLPEALRQAILDAKADFAAQIAAAKQARTQLEEKRAQLEAISRELAGKIANLHYAAVQSDAGAADLVQNETRARAVNLELDGVKAALEAKDSLNVGFGIGVLERIIAFYREAVKNAMVADIADYGFQASTALPFVYAADAYKILNILRDWAMCASNNGSERHIAYMEQFFDRALAGNVNLNCPPEQATAQA